jgi:hypothetical protein
MFVMISLSLMTANAPAPQDFLPPLKATGTPDFFIGVTW